MAEFTPEKCKQIALARLDIVHQWLEFRKKSQNKLQADYDFVKLHNTSNSHLFEILGKISRDSLHHWYAMLDKKRFEKGREQELFNCELLNFAHKIMDKISNDIDNNQQTPQAEMYSLMNILKNLPQVKRQIIEQTQKQKPKTLSSEHFKQIEKELFGIEYE